jgi:hypothetical protein
MELKDMYDQLIEVIEEIDTKLDSLTGGKSSSKTKIVNELTKKHETSWNPAVNDMIAQLETLDPETQAAVYNGFVSSLRKQFEKSVNSYVEGLVDSQPVQQPLISEEEAEVLSKKRSEVYQKVKSIVEVAATFDEDYDMPRIRRGSTGKRGPRNMSLFTFFIDGVEVDATIGQIAKDNGYDKAAELTDALRASGFDTKGGSEIESFELPNGKILSGVREDDEEEEEDSPYANGDED